MKPETEGNITQLRGITVSSDRGMRHNVLLHVLCHEIQYVKCEQWRSNGVGRMGKVQGAPEFQVTPLYQMHEMQTIIVTDD